MIKIENSTDSKTEGLKQIFELMDGVIREVYLSSKIYDCFKSKKYDLITILSLLSYYKQPIEIHFNDGKKINNGIIENINLYEDEQIDLVVNDETIELSNTNEIPKILVLSSNYPTSKVGGLPSMNTKTLFDNLINHKNYSKMVEIYSTYCINRDIKNDSLEKFIERLNKPTENSLSLSERGNKYIRIVK